MADYPYFPFYPADWVSSPKIICSTLVQQGAYIRLLCLCWLSGDCSLPDDDTKLSTLSGLPIDQLPAVRIFFVQHPRKRHALTNERLLKEWDKAQRITAARAEAGVKSGKSRRTYVQHKLNKRRTFAPISDSESESYSESKLTPLLSPPAGVSVVSAFEQFWNAYPRKIGKKAALQAWKKAKDRPPVVDIIQALRMQEKSEQWTKENGQFIPHPSTWLNQGRWADTPLEVNGISDPHGTLAGIKAFLERGR